MPTKAVVDEFLSRRILAVVGVSRNRQKFSNTAYRELKGKGYRLLPVNPNTDTLDGDRCYSSLKELPEPVDAVLIMAPPPEAEKVVREASAAGIRLVWLQQGTESQAAIRFCQEHDMSVIYGHCILMFAEPAAFFHRTHRWVCGLLGKLPR